MSDRKEDLDRWSAEHDRACAYVLNRCSHRVAQFAMTQAAIDPTNEWKIRNHAQIEVSLSSGFADICYQHWWHSPEHDAISKELNNPAYPSDYPRKYPAERTKSVEHIEFDDRLSSLRARKVALEQSKPKTMISIVEVKTGTVIAGDVIRQLRRYNTALDKDKASDFRGDGARCLVLVHCKPLSPAAAFLLDFAGIFALDLSRDEQFASFGKVAVPGED